MPAPSSRSRVSSDLRVSIEVHNSDVVVVGEQNIRRDGVVGFAAGEVWRQDVAGEAGTFVGARGVEADLRAGPGLVALVDIPAEMFVVRLRREARVTVALVAPGPAHTDLAAGGGTAGVLTAVQLVREVSAVILAVAEQLGLQAEAVLTAWPDCERTELQTLLFSSPPAGGLALRHRAWPRAHSLGPRDRGGGGS